MPQTSIRKKETRRLYQGKTYQLMSIKNHPKLAVLILFCVALVSMRIMYTDSRVYLFLIWNLFLGVVPFLLSKFAVLLFNRGSRLVTVICILLCILFLPNAPYIVTDLFHLRYSKGAPIWFDSVMIFSFALTGLVLFYRSIENIEQISRQLMSRPFTFLTTSCVIFASAFGMYLGRYLRFNSWDIISDPLYLLHEVMERFFYPFEHTQTWGMTFIYGLFLMVVYFLMLPTERKV